METNAGNSRNTVIFEDDDDGDFLPNNIILNCATCPDRHRKLMLHAVHLDVKNGSKRAHRSHEA